VLCCGFVRSKLLYETENRKEYERSTENYNLYYPPDISMIKWKKISWVWHVACMVEKRNLYTTLAENPEGSNNLETQAVGGKQILMIFYISC
jgi:hypothetical protein